jgi:hypothetical protein
MKHAKWLPYLLICFVLLFLGGIGLVFAQDAPPKESLGSTSEGVSDINTYLVSPTISYQGKLVSDGSPVDGLVSMTFRLYNVASSGAHLWSEGPDNIEVDNGLFTKILGEKNTLPISEFDQELWLEIEVDGTILPRQKMRGAPYAFSLAPGADISGSITSSNSIMDVLNYGDGYGMVSWSSDGVGLLASSTSDHGLQAQSLGTGLAGSALYARNPNEAGIALWAHNDSVTSNDAALVVSNDGTGILMKGFGGDGGEDEFRILNDGTIETKADSIFFIPATNMVAAQQSDIIKYVYNQNGSISIFQDSGGGSTEGAWFYLPINIPAVLYGRQVTLEQITIYYRCASSNYGFISETSLFQQTSAITDNFIYDDNTDYKETTAAAYTWDLSYPYAGGPLNLAFYVVFEDIWYPVTIGGIQVRLGHHSLYEGELP